LEKVVGQAERRKGTTAMLGGRGRDLHIFFFFFSLVISNYLLRFLWLQTSSRFMRFEIFVLLLHPVISLEESSQLSIVSRRLVPGRRARRAEGRSGEQDGARAGPRHR
jgi:hypothetical protein